MPPRSLSDEDLRIRAPGGATGVRFRLRGGRGSFAIDVDLDVPRAGITALFGPSGAGKSTCLRMVSGLDRGRGEVHVLGECWQDDARGVFVPVHRRGVGFVFQDHPLFRHLSVGGNLAYGRRRAAARGRIDPDQVIDRFGVTPLLDRRPDELSGGERQRVAMAQALLAQPRLLLMDEPLAALDARRKAEILPYLERLRDDLSIPVVYVSHVMEEVARLADHIVLLDAGRVVASGAIRDVLARLDLPIADGDEGGVLVDGIVQEHDEPNGLSGLAIEGGTLWVGRVDRPLGARVRVRALARDVSLALAEPGRSTILNVLRARVVEVRDLGADRVNVRLALGDAGPPLIARITRRSLVLLDLRPGVRVYAQMKSAALVL
ncbi:MAG TPA: molybdenum ABC transporter ATP-binding protein [Polyangiaceae bacterium]|nr:molybdenum ABC transporter ATP-binding protein [Polyangiaceae bacterium]